MKCYSVHVRQGVQAFPFRYYPAGQEHTPLAKLNPAKQTVATVAELQLWAPVAH